MDVRPALATDVDAICAFGAQHIPPLYTPLLGAAAAERQVEQWWTHERLQRAAADGRAVVAVDGDEVVGFGECSQYDGVPMIWKLYVDPAYRGNRLGPRLLAAIVDQLPADSDRIRVETFSVNRRAAGFYVREGFRQVRTWPGRDPSLDVTWYERAVDRSGGRAWVGQVGLEPTTDGL